MNPGCIRTAGTKFRPPSLPALPQSLFRRASRVLRGILCPLIRPDASARKTFLLPFLDSRPVTAFRGAEAQTLAHRRMADCRIAPYLIGYPTTSARNSRGRHCHVGSSPFSRDCSPLFSDREADYADATPACVEVTQQARSPHPFHCMCLRIVTPRRNVSAKEEMTIQ